MMLTKPANELDMSNEEFEMIRDFIHEKSGIYFAENKMYLLKSRLSKRMESLGIGGYRDYFYHIKYDSSQREFGQLMNLVTTNETSFYRNEPQLKSFAEEVLPQFIEDRKASGRKALRIWSAGCSTGEEPYTLAMIILERLPDPSGWNIEIIANDISEQVLGTARAGAYSGITLRNTAPYLLSKYFDRAPNGVFNIKQKVKSLVRFSQINLNDPRQLARYSNVDTVFCRNVMIYFSDEVKKRIVRGYYNALSPGGYLYVGHSETLHGISKAFKLVYLKNALVYQKEAPPVDQRPKAAATITGARATATSAAGGAARALDLLSKIKSGTNTK
ncbi:MAG: protein-glutamate O-methyltransferase CheR [bacterium]